MNETKNTEPAPEVVSSGWFAYWLRSLHPRYWLQNYSYSPAWDAWLNAAMDRGRFEQVTRYTAQIEGKTLWVGNHPYASFTNHIGPEVRPRRTTIVRAWDKLIEDTVANTEVMGERSELHEPTG